MLEDACHHPIRKFKCAPPGNTVHYGRATRSDRIKKGAQFRTKRLLFLRWKCRKIEFRLWSGFDDAHAKGVLARKIHGNVLMLLEKTQLAHSLGGDTARRDVGNGAGSEIEPRMRNIDFVSEDRYADRFYFRDRCIHESEQDV